MNTIALSTIQRSEMVQISLNCLLINCYAYRVREEGYRSTQHVTMSHVFHFFPQEVELSYGSEGEAVDNPCKGLLVYNEFSEQPTARKLEGSEVCWGYNYFLIYFQDEKSIS